MQIHRKKEGELGRKWLDWPDLAGEFVYFQQTESKKAATPLTVAATALNGYLDLVEH